MKKGKTPPAYDFEGQLDQSLLSQAGETNLSINRSQQEGEMGENGGYGEYQIPPSIELAEHYWASTGIGRKPSSRLGDFPGERQSSLGPKLEKFPYCTNPMRIRGFGSTIPIYYLFMTCCIVILLIEYLGTLYLGIVYRNAYCERMMSLKGIECSFFDKMSYKINLTVIDLKTAPTPLKEKVSFGMTLHMISIYVMFLVVILFSMQKIKLKFACKDQVKQGVVSEFTIMVEKVNGNDPRGLEPVHQFIAKMMQSQGLAPPEVAKALLAKATGKIERARNELEHSKEELKAIWRHKSILEANGQNQEAGNNLGSKNLERLVKKQQKKIKKLEKNYARLQRRRGIEITKNLKVWHSSPTRQTFKETQF